MQLIDKDRIKRDSPSPFASGPLERDIRPGAGSCRFCSHFAGAYGDVVDEPWLKNSRYCALVSKGALVPGWTLVCPLEHKLNLAADYQRSEFWNFTSRVAAIVQARYGDACVFEHGARYSGSLTGCGTDHAHIHLLSLPFSLVTEALRYESTLEWEPCWAVEIKQRARGCEYLFVADRFDGDQTQGFICLPQAPISQYFRRVIASRLGVEERYDYRRHPMLDIARQSVMSLRSDVSAAETSYCV